MVCIYYCHLRRPTLWWKPWQPLEGRSLLVPLRPRCNTSQRPTHRWKPWRPLKGRTNAWYPSTMVAYDVQPIGGSLGDRGREGRKRGRIPLLHLLLHSGLHHRGPLSSTALLRVRVDSSHPTPPRAGNAWPGVRIAELKSNGPPRGSTPAGELLEEPTKTSRRPGLLLRPALTAFCRRTCTKTLQQWISPRTEAN